jgi:hypothetical protein
MAHDDDLEMWDDDPLVRALRAPGTPAELAGEDGALAAFRSAVPNRSRRRLARRMGTGAGTFAVAVALSGGVAAAYSHALPDPVQRVAHSWFGGIGVGAPRAPHALTAGHVRRPHPTHGPGSPVAPNPTGTTAPSVPSPTHRPAAAAHAASSRPSRPGAHPTAHPVRSVAPKAPAGPAPVTSPVASPKPTPSASSPGQSRLRPSAVTAAVSAQRISPASSVTMSGRLTTNSGAAVPGRRVVAQSRPAGQHQGWSVVGSARTDASGEVTIDVPAVGRTTRLRLKASHRVHSSVATVVVVPTVSASVSRDGDRYDVTVTSDGLQPGDQIVVVRGLGRHRTVVERLAVDGSGSTSFSVAVPRKRNVTFRVHTPRTSSHAAAKTSFVAPSG